MDRGSRQWSGWLVGLLLLLTLAACGGAPPVTGPTAAPPTAVASGAPSATGTTAASTAPAATRTSAPSASVATATRAASPATPSGTATRVATAGTPAATTYPLTIKDDLGRAVTIARRPQRIVSLAPSNTELLFALGMGARVVGVDKYSNYPPEVAGKPQISDYAATNLEQVLAVEPDLILAAGIIKRDIVAAFESRGLAVVVLAPPDLDDVLANVTLLGQAADANADAARLRAAMAARVAAVNDRLRGTTTKPRVFFELDASQFYTVGPKSFIDDLITRAGGANIAADAGTPYPSLSQEQIIAKDPEVIILSDEGYGVTVESVKGRPGWAGISAVKTGRIAAIDPDVANRPGPRVVDALERLALLIHPELFR